MRQDFGHGEPIGSHWDYWDANKNHFRSYKDGRVEYVSNKKRKKGE